MGKALTIAIWGCNGCGKTTLAVNLTTFLAKRQKIVGLISASTYNELGTYFDTIIPEEKGIKAIKTHPTEEIKMFYVPAGRDTSAYFLGPATDSVIADNVELDVATGRRIVEESKELFDILIIDCAPSILDAISSEAVARCDSLVIPINANMAYEQWFKCNARDFECLGPRCKFVENMVNSECNIQQLYKMMNVVPCTSLQYIEAAPALFQKGAPLYAGLGRTSKIYEAGLCKLWDCINSQN